MPQSDYWALPWVLEVASAMRPKSVLDVGVGMGQYGLHLRQLLDIGHERLTKPQWLTRIDGIEVFEPYRNPLWEYYYDQVRMGDCRDVLRTTEAAYDLILICDVIEHFDRQDAESLLALARQRAGWVIITTPNGEYPQGAVFGNEAEAHRSVWRPRDFSSLGGTAHEIRGTFMAVFRGAHPTAGDPKLSDLPDLFENTGRSLARCVRKWVPRMLRSRLGGVRPSRLEGYRG